ncbi:Glycine/D-amino acid oxidase [Rhizobiales bacterium GAS191]|nr:Glycine/D-amino acid oxidase [Rhizobiales bacterium GAS113]SEC77791.1 Glycine/D-amino acid oxidase [Rhizobiales bacterium GAS191]
MKAIVIGAGIVGSGVAYRLAEAGVEVTILEADRVGGGTSGISFAWTNSHGKEPRHYHDLNVAGMKAHAALAEEFPGQTWFHPSGSVAWRKTPQDREAMTRNFERLKSWGYAIEWIDRKRLAELEPDIDIDRVGDAIITYCPQEGYVDPVVYADAMVKAAQKRGAKLKTGVKVVDVETRNGNVTGVKGEDGSRHEADIVVNCAGRWAARVAQEPGLKLPLAPTTGFIVFTPPVATSVKHLVHAPDIHFRPDGAGRLMVRTNAADDLVSLDMTPSPTMPQAVEIMRRAAEVIPALKTVKAEAARITARPIPQDGLSAVGPTPRVNGYYFVVTHSGVTLSPFLAKAVTDEIVHNKTRPELENFRPSRFFN